MTWRARATSAGNAATPRASACRCPRKKIGNRWLFHIRGKRNERWLEHAKPPLEDWLELLDAVRRRIQRDLIPEIEEDRLIKTIREKFPEATL